MYHHVYREAVQRSVHSSTCLCRSLRRRLSPIRYRLLFITGTEFVYCAVRAEALNLVGSIPGCAMTQTVSPRPFATEARVRSPVSSCEIRVGKGGPGTGFSSITPVPSIVVFPPALYTHISFIYHQLYTGCIYSPWPNFKSGFITSKQSKT